MTLMVALQDAAHCALGTGKPVEINNRERSTILRQTVIRLKPNYFALPEIERDAYRLHLTSEDDFRIR